MTYLLLLLLYGQKLHPSCTEQSLRPHRDPTLPALPPPPHPSYRPPFILVFQRCPEAPAGLSPTDFMDCPSCGPGLTIFWTPQPKPETLTTTEPPVHPRIQRIWMYHLPWDYPG